MTEKKHLIMKRAKPEQHKKEILQIGDGLRFGIGFLLAPIIVSFIISLFVLAFYIFILIFG